MATDVELLTPSEAAVIASVTVRDVNRIIDEKLLPDDFYSFEGGRRLHLAACPLIGFYFHAANALTAEERGVVIRQASARIVGKVTGKRRTQRRKRLDHPADWMIQDRFLTVNLSEFAASAHDRHAKLAQARKMVVEDSDILNGTPVIRGTRIPVYDVAASAATGLPRERIRSAYPDLDDRMIELAAIYAEAVPPRGRPPRSQSLLPGTKILSKRTVPRRRKG
jgi:uncharacterized protein (DUF433 family)